MTREEYRYGRIYGIAAFVSFWCIVYAISVPLLLPSYLPEYVTAPAVFLIMVAGWLIQAFFCRISRFDRKEDQGTYENGTRFFSPGRAALPTVTAIVIGLLMIAPLNELIVFSANCADALYYPDDSLLPFLYGMLVSALLICGSVLWFYPYERFANLKYPLVGIPVLLGAFIVSAIAGASTVPSALCLLVYCVVVLVLMNQGNISRRYAGNEAVGSLSGRARIYNAALTLTLLVLLAGVFVILFAGICGFAVIGRFILMLLLNHGSGDDTDKIVDDPASEAVGYIFGKTSAERALNEVSFVFLLLIFIATLVFVIFRRTEAIKSLIEGLKSFISELSDFFSSLFERDRRKKARTYDRVYASYRDEERQRYRPSRRAKGNGPAPAVSYDDFRSKLKSINDNRGRLGYAYSTLVSGLMGAGKFIKRSDTPRRIAEKLSTDRDYSDIRGITETFELVAYADRDPGDERTAEALDVLCRMIHRP